MNTASATIVVGGGILGASLALLLAERGLEAVVLDAGDQMPQATPGAMGWINARLEVDAAYFSLRMRAIAAWRVLHQRYPHLPLRFDGGLSWEADEEQTEARASSDESRGYPVRRLLPADAARIAPSLAVVPALSLMSPAEGCVDPGRITGALLTLAAAAGAHIHHGARVVAVTERAGAVSGVRLADGTALPAAQVVIAAGLGTHALLAAFGSGLPMTGGTGLILRTPPVPPLLGSFLNIPGLYGWQMADGRLIMGESLDSDCDESRVPALTQALLARLARAFPAAAPHSAQQVMATRRTIPADDRPVAGPVAGLSGLHVLATHSGVTLAPILARYMASEIATGLAEPGLAPHRLSRFGRLSRP